jgi:hypothetical protein
MFEGLFQPLHFLLVTVIGFLTIFPFWHIFKKAGFSPWLSLLVIVPFVGWLPLWYLAFAKWPASSK